MPANGGSAARRAAWPFWLAALAAAFIALAATGYRARDPDSRLYAELSARLSRAPVASWIAPEFPPGWFMSGPFREHPAGLFVPAAALAALGYPAEQAAYAMNAVYQALGIVLLQQLAVTRAPALESRALGWLIQLLPIAFTFRVRANHEAAVLLCLAAAIYGTERSIERRRYAALVAAGFGFLLLVKGLLVVFAPIVCAAWLVSRRVALRARGDLRGWLAIVLGVASTAAVGFGYEAAYRAATGEPFWPLYAARQLGVAAVGSGESNLLAGRIYTAFWYLARLVWFAFPWSVVFAVAVWRARGREAGSADAALRAGALFAMLSAALYLAAFSLSDRRADRYIFPAYYAVAAAGIVAALRASPRLRRLAERLDRPWVPALAWALLFAAHVAAGRLGLPTIKIWAG